LDFCIGSDYYFIKWLPSVGCQVVHNDQHLAFIGHPRSRRSSQVIHARPTCKLSALTVTP